jgi:hypothetical protein
VERDGYVRRLASDLNVPEVQIYDEMNVMKFSKNHPAKQALQEVKKIQYQPEELLIGLLLNYPKYFFETKIDLSQGYFTEKVNTIYNQFLSNYNPQGIDQTAVLATLTGLDEELRSQASLMSLYVEEKYGDIPEDLIGKEVQDLVAKIQHQNMATMRQKLQRQLKEAEATNNQQEMERVLIELSNLSRVN